MLYKNNFILAAAGAGKTTKIVEQALSLKGKQVLITTFTRENSNHIIRTIEKNCGFLPPNIIVKPWFSFLLADCIRPYQNFLYDKERIENVYFSNMISNKFIKKTDVSRYYFNKSMDICSDKLSEFAFESNKISRNKVINRLEGYLDHIFIDEAQDLSGYDFEILELLLKSKIQITMVGDSRQNTYNTSTSPKNKGYSRDIFSWFTDMERRKNGTLIHLNISQRCNQIICDFSDELFPNMPKTTSKNDEITEHDGIFFLPSTLLFQYYEKFKPTILTYDKRTKHFAQGLPTMNFGESKGLTFDRVIIIANGPIEKYLNLVDISTVKGSLNKFYVAITRARYSVTFLTNKPVKHSGVNKY